MSGVKKYFKKEFQTSSFFLEHDTAPDFYLCCWQRNRSAWTLMCIRAIIFIGCLGTLIAGLIINGAEFSFSLWFIFLTHLGLIFNSLTAGFALAISLRVLYRGPIDSSLELPWYIKCYWAMYNVSVPIALFITVFYWSLLTDLDVEIDFALNPVLDVFVHGVNSALMLALVLTGRHPTRLLHFYWPLGIALLYLIFTIIFHFGGGISPFGTSWIYPMLDWDEPGMTMILVAISAVGIIAIHCIICGISVCRDKLTRQFRESNSLSIN